ncbi:hypothetical protein M9H77_30802 [Catharanthus roseus]|uniref:Uncharacterized protein n=1 Tax=Catharanthus roseus TaxID=4058 RepID=A0ACC0A048_CATRO|nr:hypothetical protein M9H77_30802 [Catharanthus roseus]
MGTNFRIDSPWEQTEPKRRAYLRFLLRLGRPLKTTIPSVKHGKKLSLVLVLYQSAQDELSNLGESYSNSLNPSLKVGEVPTFDSRGRPMPLLELSSYYTSPPMH